MSGSTSIVAVMLAAITAAACAPAGDGSSEETARDTLAAREPVVAESLGLEAVPAPEDVPLLPGEGEPRAFRLLLVNRLDDEAFVFASAGAARVALDTVPRADSVFVDIRLRADHVDLEAEDGSGRVVSTTSIDLVRGQINRWEMTPDGRARVSLAPRVRGPGCGAPGSTRCNSLAATTRLTR
ncbi:MAG: hypothetical protein R3195_13315 [Gemmatimonadota bacterium]|nr:hypothetical protein [Gemmatimonadota bacterium]